MIEIGARDSLYYMDRENSTPNNNSRPGRTGMPEGLPHIGEMIRQEIRSRKLTGAWLAARLGCDRTNVYKMFKKPTIDTLLLLRVSVILGRDFFAMYSGELAGAIDRNARKN